MRRYGSVWLVASDRSFLSWAYVVYHCRTSSLQDDTPVCHECLVVNGTSTLTKNIPSRHGCLGANVWSPALETRSRVLMYSHPPGPLKQCCFSHSAYWLPTRNKLLYTLADPARGLLNTEHVLITEWHTQSYYYVQFFHKLV